MSLWKVNAISESTPGSGVTVTGLISTNPTVTLPTGGDADLTTATLGWIFASGVSKAIGLARLGGFIARQFGFYIVTDPKFGATGDGTTDDTAAINAAIAAMPATDCVLYFPAGTYKITSQITLTRRGLRFVGVRDGRPTQGGGSRLRLVVTAGQQVNPISCIQLGTSGVANNPFFDASYENGGPGGVPYQGQQELYFQNISFDCIPATTGAIANSSNTYGTNTVAVRDYYGGSIRMDGVQIEGFDYPFWGVNSDFDDLRNVTVLYCNHGPYFGPRSDQVTTSGLQVNVCNDGLWLDRCLNHTHIGVKIIDCGDSAGTRFGIKLGNQYTGDACFGHTFIGTWLEIGGNSTPPVQNIESYIQIGGDADAFPVRDTTFLRTTIVTGVQGGTPHAQYLAHIGNGYRIRFEGVSPNYTNLLKGFHFTSAGTSHVHLEAHSDFVATYTNTGAGTPVVSSQSTGYGDHIFGGANGRLHAIYTTQAAGYANEYFIGSESQFGFFVSFPNISNVGNANNILSITRILRHAAAAPVTGTWSVGDRVLNNAPAVGQPKSWVCTVAGTPGTWVSEGNL